MTFENLTSVKTMITLKAMRTMRTMRTMVAMMKMMSVRADFNLRCVFSNVSSKCLPVKVHSHMCYGKFFGQPILTRHRQSSYLSEAVLVDTTVGKSVFASGNRFFEAEFS